MADLSLGFRFQHGLVHARTVSRTIALGQVVELIDIDIVRLQKLQRGLQILPETLGGLSVGLGGDVHFLSLQPAVAEGSAQLLLAVRISSGGIEIAHAAFIGPPQELYCFLLRDALNGQRAESILRDHDPGGSQGDAFHVLPPVIIILHETGPLLKSAFLVSVREQRQSIASPCTFTRPPSGH